VDLSAFDADVDGFGLVQFGIFSLHFFFEACQSVVQCIHVMLDACEATMKRIVDLSMREIGRRLCSSGR